jgi:hypothetical protein
VNHDLIIVVDQGGIWIVDLASGEVRKFGFRETGDELYFDLAKNEVPIREGEVEPLDRRDFRPSI